MRFAIYIRTVQLARGAEKVSAALASGLAARGHLVDFLVENSEGWLLEELASGVGRIEIIDLRAAHHSQRQLNRLFQGYALAKNLFASPLSLFSIRDGCTKILIRVMFREDPPILSLYRYIKHRRPHAVISFLNYPNLVLLLTAQLCKDDTRVIVNVRNHISMSAKHAKSKWTRDVPRLMRRFFRIADRIVVPSQGVAEDVMRITGLPEGRVTTIHNPVYRPDVTLLSSERLDHRWLDQGDIPVIVGAGKLKPQKDFNTLLRAFAIVRQQRRARLIICGEGRQRDSLMNLASELEIAADVDLPGFVRNLYAVLGRASVFVLSSAWEGLPNVLIEALACGCPVVSTDCPSGPAEILSNGAFGKLVPVGDEIQMAHAILQTLEAPPTREKMIARAKCFSFDDAMARYEQVLTGCNGAGSETKQSLSRLGDSENPGHELRGAQ